MEPKEIAIPCPCCDARLVVDVRTGKVVTWSRAGEVDAQGRPKMTESDWDEAHARARGRLGEGLDKLEEGLEREGKRSKDLDELWKKLEGGGEDEGEE